MFGLDFWELAIIFVVALIALGPRRLPEVAKSLGNALAEFRKASNDLRRTLDDATRTPLVPPPAPTTPERPEPAPRAPEMPPATPTTTATAPSEPIDPRNLHG